MAPTSDFQDFTRDPCTAVQTRSSSEAQSMTDDVSNNQERTAIPEPMEVNGNKAHYSEDLTMKRIFKKDNVCMAAHENVNGDFLVKGNKCDHAFRPGSAPSTFGCHKRPNSSQRNVFDLSRSFSVVPETRTVDISVAAHEEDVAYSDDDEWSGGETEVVISRCALPKGSAVFEKVIEEVAPDVRTVDSENLTFTYTTTADFHERFARDLRRSSTDSKSISWADQHGLQLVTELGECVS